jgi:hypothetical protein
MSNSKISALTSATTPLAGTEVLPVVQSSTTKQVSVANLTAGRAVRALSLSCTSTISTTIASKTAAFDAAGGSIYSTFDDGTTNWRIGSGIQAAGKFSLYAVTGAVNAFTVDTSGNLNLGVGNLVPSTAAKGINFTANTPLAGKTSQLLNWYEEGTWTPTAVPGAGAITTYASGGTYTRVGRQVTVTAYVDLTNVGTASGTLQISNLPFKNGAMSGAGYLQQMGIARETGVTGVNYGCVIAGGAPYTSIYITTLTGGSILWVNTYQYALSITYYTA